MGRHRQARRGWSSYRRAAVTAALLLMVLGLLSAVPAAAATGTYVRLAQLTEDMPGAELVVASASGSSIVRIPAVGYGELSEYRRIEPGVYVIAVRPTGSDVPPLVGTTLNAVAGSAYTLAVVEGNTERGLKILTDDLTPPGAGQSKVRMIDAAAVPPRLDVRGLAGEPFGLGLARGEASGYQPVLAGRVVLRVGPPGGPTSDLPITVGAGQVVSVVLTARDGAVAAAVRVDAEGPAAIPPGPLNAGFGGGAGSRPGGTAGVLVFMVLAAAAASLSVYLARRTRGARHRPC